MIKNSIVGALGMVGIVAIIALAARACNPQFRVKSGLDKQTQNSGD
jgi:hypothetical protein